jgi:hypothetical protein
MCDLPAYCVIINSLAHAQWEPEELFHNLDLFSFSVNLALSATGHVLYESGSVETCLGSIT